MLQSAIDETASPADAVGFNTKQELTAENPADLAHRRASVQCLWASVIPGEIPVNELSGHFFTGK
jgi:hypothetical protein